MSAAGVAPASVARITRMVLATRQGIIWPEGVNAQLLVDIDFAILGSEATRFAEYEGQIRRDYAFVPDAARFWPASRHSRHHSTPRNPTRGWTQAHGTTFVQHARPSGRR